MVKCKYYKYENTCHVCSKVGKGCPFAAISHDYRTQQVFPEAWNWAKELCKYYEVEPEDQWAIFAIVKNPTNIVGVINEQNSFPLNEYTIQTSTLFQSEQRAYSALPSWMKNVVVRRVSND